MSEWRFTVKFCIEADSYKEASRKADIAMSKGGEAETVILEKLD